ncbi:hypothetical protein [Nocardia sp. NPDC004260]
MQATDTVTVAVRPITGPTGAPADWRILDVTHGSLDHPEAIGEEIYAHLRAENPDHHGYHANIAIMVSPDVPGYPAGCSIHTEHRPYNGYTGSDYRRAWREHWNCEHDRFGTPGIDPNRPRSAEDLAAAVFNRVPDTIEEWHGQPGHQFMMLTNGDLAQFWEGDYPDIQTGGEVHWTIPSLTLEPAEGTNPDISTVAELICRAAEHDPTNTD